MADPSLITWKSELPLGEIVHVVRHCLRPGHGWSLHRHDFAEVFWVESGSGVHRVSDTDHILRSGDIWCLRPEHAHTARSGPLGMTIVNVSFQPGTVAALARRHGGRWPWRPGAPAHARLSPRRMERLHAWSVELASRRRLLDLDGFLLDLAGLLAESQDQAEVLPGWLGDAIDAFRDEPDLAGGTARLARKCGRSPDHLNRTVQRCLGITATDLITGWRLDRAAAELRLGERPIPAIAGSVGLANLGHFYRRFQARFGTTPRRYRMSARQLVASRSD